AICRESLLGQGPGTILHQVDSTGITVGEILKMDHRPYVALVRDDELLAPPGWAEGLIGVLQAVPGAAAAGPVSCLAEIPEQICSPTVSYQTRWGFRDFAVQVEKRAEGRSTPVSSLDPFLILYRRRALAALPAGTPAAEIPYAISRTGWTFHLAGGVYVHRSGDHHAFVRPELAALVPDSAKMILDVGCAKAALGRYLKERQGAYVVGVEANEHLAGPAKEYLDEVWPVKLEDLAENWIGRYDCIIFGDVLEHMIDPWASLTQVRPWLRPEAPLILSLPNVGYWEIVAGLLAGQWEYLPLGIMDVTHLRFFTAATITTILNDCGFRIEQLTRHQVPLSPAGERFIDTLVQTGQELDPISLCSPSLTVTAKGLK
ncbi:MAG: class I SAM-dependent methyltransferase, partial [Deltaproteobacteria bacterium]|nr:class I SAM-dependent methyltransferase [Deltaproteobacteria bacterium]